MRIKLTSIITIIGTTLALSLTACGQKKASDMNLNSLTKQEYNAFVREISKAHKEDAQAVGEQSKQIIIGMAGLENRPESHGVFEVDVNFNTNAMLLLVANGNKIRREQAFIDEFKRQMAATRPKLKTEDQKTYFDVFTALLLSEHAKLPQ